MHKIWGDNTEYMSEYSNKSVKGQPTRNHNGATQDPVKASCHGAICVI